MKSEIIRESVEYIKSKINCKPSIALILGSGLGDIAEEVEDAIYIDYKDKLIFNIDLHYDYLMYISKINRVNENLIKLVREDWESKYGIL